MAQILTQARSRIAVPPRRIPTGSAAPSSAEIEAPIRLAIVDDHPAMLRGLQSLFDPDRRYRVTATGNCAADVSTIADRAQCEVIIVDLGLPGDVFGALQHVAVTAPGIKLLVYTAHESVDLAVRAIDIGVNGYVLKGSPIEDLHEAITVARRGEIYVSPAFAFRVFAGMHRTKSESNRRLSGRERQLIKCLLEGKSNKEIAAALRLTEKTVKHYMTNLMGKLHVHSRLEVVVAAQRWSDGALLAHDVNNDTALPLFSGRF